MNKVIKLPPADCYKYPNKGYGINPKRSYKELRANKESWSRFRTKLLVKQNFKCAYCLVNIRGKRMNIEHVTPLKKGGTNNISNLVASCAGCNKKKANKLLSGSEKKLLKENLELLRKESVEEKKLYNQQVDIIRQLDEEFGYELQQMFKEE